MLASMLAQDNKRSNYIRSFASVKLPSSVVDLPGMNESDDSTSRAEDPDVLGDS